MIAGCDTTAHGGECAERAVRLVLRKADMHSSAAFVAASVGGTLLIYVVRLIIASKAVDQHQHFQWRCPMGTATAVLFAGAQVFAVLGVAVKYSAVTGIQRRQSTEPPAGCPLWYYLIVSVTSAVMLGFGLLWAGGVAPAPRCLSGSAMCLRLLENLEATTGWVAVACIALMLCQVAGAVSSGRALRCCCAGTRAEVHQAPAVGGQG